MFEIYVFQPTLFILTKYLFSIDEMATIDMPLIMDFISKTTARRGNIYYIGHSLGTTIALMYAAAYPEESAQHVRMFVFMAPAYTLSNMISPYKQIVPLVPLVWVNLLVELTLKCDNIIKR